MRASVSILSYVGLTDTISHIKPELLAAVVLKGGGILCSGRRERMMSVALEWSWVGSLTFL